MVARCRMRPTAFWHFQLSAVHCCLRSAAGDSGLHTVSVNMTLPNGLPLLANGAALLSAITFPLQLLLKPRYWKMWATGHLSHVLAADVAPLSGLTDRVAQWHSFPSQIFQGKASDYLSWHVRFHVFILSLFRFKCILIVLFVVEQRCISVVVLIWVHMPSNFMFCHVYMQ